MDPGEHLIEARQGVHHARQQLRVKEGARVTVSLHLASLPSASAPTREPSRRAARAPSVPDTRDRPRPRAALWLTLAGAGVGVVAGTVTGVMAANTRESLVPSCPRDVCPPEYADEVGRFNTLRTVATASFLAGGVGLAAASLIWLTQPERSAAMAARVRPSVGVWRVGLDGAF